MNPTDAQQAREQFEELYRRIEIERMQGVPILNHALSVEAVGFESVGDARIGVLITPWFMNLVVLPQDEERYLGGNPVVGASRHLHLPAGVIEFLIAGEEGRGLWLMCSLFSPMHEFADQEAARQTALAALEHVLTAPEPEVELEPQAAEPAQLTRRALFSRRREVEASEQ
ncbi:MAG: [NiFe]-hydrogenase assembly chaperone HybE [Planctomycetota bacterium]